MSQCRSVQELYWNTCFQFSKCVHDAKNNGSQKPPLGVVDVHCPFLWAETCECVPCALRWPLAALPSNRYLFVSSSSEPRRGGLVTWLPTRRSTPGCGCCIFDEGENAAGQCAHVKDPSGQCFRSCPLQRRIIIWWRGEKNQWLVITDRLDCHGWLCGEMDLTAKSPLHWRLLRKRPGWPFRLQEGGGYILAVGIISPITSGWSWDCAKRGSLLLERPESSHRNALGCSLS